MLAEGTEKSVSDEQPANALPLIIVTGSTDEKDLSEEHPANALLPTQTYPYVDSTDIVSREVQNSNALEHKHLLFQ